MGKANVEVGTPLRKLSQPSLRNWSQAAGAGGGGNTPIGRGSDPGGSASYGQELLLHPNCNRKLLQGVKQKSGRF